MFMLVVAAQLTETGQTARFSEVPRIVIPSNHIFFRGGR
jgi:hypothetical protein